MLAASFLYSLFFTVNHLALGDWAPASLRRLMDGTAITPMQYQVLVPWMARIMDPLLPALPNINHLNAIEFILEFGAVFGLLAVFLWGTYCLLGDAYPEEDKRLFRLIMLWLAFLFFTIALPFHYLTPRILLKAFYPYDIPAVVFFMIGCVAALRGQMLLFYTAFIVGTVNRETTCFLTVFLLLVAWRTRPKKALLFHAVAQAILWLGIKAWLFHLYARNTDPAYCTVGGLFKNSVYANTQLYFLAIWALLPSVYGFLWIPLLLVWRHIRSDSLKRGIWLVPIFHVAMFVPGELLELRIYAEMLPLVVWGVVFGLAALLSKPQLSPQQI